MGAVEGVGYAGDGGGAGGGARVAGAVGGVGNGLVALSCVGQGKRGGRGKRCLLEVVEFDA